MTDDLQMRLDLMSRDHGFAPGTVERFGHWVRTAEDHELFRVGVLQWAESHEVAEGEAIDLFLHATKAGIFEMSWGVLCPKCGMLVTTPGGLRALGPDPHCSLCRLEFPASLDDQVEVTFSLEPAIRRLRYYDPEKIDYGRDLFKIFFSPSFELTGEQSVMNTLRTAATLPPGQDGALELEAAAGLYPVICPSVHAVSFVRASEGGPQSIALEIHDGQCIPPTAAVGVGPVRIELQNRTDFAVTVGALDFGPHEPEDMGYTEFRMRPFLSGRRILTNQTFRDIFRTETIGEGGLRLKNLTILFTDLEGSTPLYERVGDLRALELVRDHFGRLEEVVRRQRGAVVKTIGDAVMAVFAEPERALAAAAGMSRAVRRIDADGGHLVLNVGIHSGACVAIDTNHQIDYFGSAVNIASRVQGAAKGGEILATDEVWDAPAVAGMAEDLGLAEVRGVVELRGVASSVVVHRLSPEE